MGWLTDDYLDILGWEELDELVIHYIVVTEFEGDIQYAEEGGQFELRLH